MSKFKVGDRVRFKSEEIERHGFHEFSDVYTISKIHDSVLSWDEKIVGFLEIPYSTYASCVEHADEHTYIVALTTDTGRPCPSKKPFVHHSRASAANEARRLAKKHPGQQFAIYQRAGGYVADVTVNMREVA